jgi:Tfp pilus assembly protein PilX
MAQRGVSLIITLIAMVAILLIGIAMVRVVDFSNLMTRNLAFREGGIHLTDVGLQYGLTALNGLSSTSLDGANKASCSANSTTFSNCYYPVNQDTNSDGIPDVIDWSTVSAINVSNSSGYTVKFVIERLCTGTLGTAVTDKAGQCQYAIPSSGSTTTLGGSKKIGSSVFSGLSTNNSIYYRVTSRADGPGSSLSMSQTILTR